VIQVQAFQIIDSVRRRRITVFDENAIRSDEAVIFRRWLPAELSLERRAAFVVTLDCDDAGQRTDERPDAFDQPWRWGKAGWYVDDQQCLAHELSGYKSPDTTRPALGGPCR
jgi:hypothetical protein